MAVREKLVKAGDWRTLEWFWNQSATLFFREPRGAQIKIRYGGGWIFGADRQKQTLDGETYKKLSVSKWSAFTARIQMYTARDTSVRYDVEPGEVSPITPPIHF
jgi:hypothetical protein